MPGGVVVLGEKELDRALRYLGGKGSRAVVRSGIRAGLTVVAKHIRKEVNATQLDTPHAASLKAGARKAVKARFAKAKSKGIYEARVGFAVGMKGGKRTERLSKGETTGAGVAGATIHWFTLGTERMPAFFKGVIAKAAASSAGPSMAKARSKIRQRIPIEARKARRGR